MIKWIAKLQLKIKCLELQHSINYNVSDALTIETKWLTATQ